MGRCLWTILAVVLFSSCTTSSPEPSKKAPIPGCSITCPEGVLLRRQHVCRGGKRWFEDITIVGRYTKRAADGTVMTDMWVTRKAAYPVDSVEIGTCQSYIDKITLGAATYR